MLALPHTLHKVQHESMSICICYDIVNVQMQHRQLRQGVNNFS